VRQSFLLNHALNHRKVPKRSFAVFLEYVEGLQGAARQRLLQAALDRVEAEERRRSVEEEEEEEEGSTATVKVGSNHDGGEGVADQGEVQTARRRSLHRAKKLVQALR